MSPKLAPKKVASFEGSRERNTELPKQWLADPPTSPAILERSVALNKIP